MNLKQITSPKNPLFKKWHSLLETKGQKKHGEIILSGKKLFKEFIHHKDLLAVIVPSKTSLQDFDLNTKAHLNHLFYLSKDLFSKLDIFSTKNPLLIFKRPNLQTLDFKKDPQGLELLCPTGDPTNLGPILRSASAFCIKVCLLPESCSPFLPKVLRASSGESLKMALDGRLTVTKEVLTKSPLFALSSKEGRRLYDFRWPKNARLIVGQEGLGLQAFKNLSLKPIFIPMSKNTESLNTAIAASLAMYEYRSFYPLQEA